MSVEQNLRVIEAFSRAFDERRWDRFFELHAQSAALWAPGLAEPLKGRAAIREWELGFVGGFPDFRFRTDQPFGHGSLACFQWTFTGTHTAPQVQAARPFPQRTSRSGSEGVLSTRSRAARSRNGGCISTSWSSSSNSASHHRRHGLPTGRSREAHPQVVGP